MLEELAAGNYVMKSFWRNRVLGYLSLLVLLRLPVFTSLLCLLLADEELCECSKFFKFSSVFAATGLDSSNSGFLIEDFGQAAFTLS